MSDSLLSYPLVVSAGPDLRDGGWHHVAVTVDRASSTGGRLYVDGIQVGGFLQSNHENPAVWEQPAYPAHRNASKSVAGLQLPGSAR